MIRDVPVDETGIWFDSDIGYEAYLAYLVGEVEGESVVLYLKRFFILRMTKAYWHLGTSTMEDLVGGLVTALWGAVQAGNLPTESIAQFYGYLNSLIRRDNAKTFESMWEDSEFWADHNMETGGRGRLPKHRDVDDRLFLEDLPKLVRRKVLDDLRFPGSLAKEAARYILSRLESGDRIVIPLLKREYGLKQPYFFIEHVQVRVRQILYELRPLIATRNMDHGVTLDEMLTEDAAIGET